MGERSFRLPRFGPCNLSFVVLRARGEDAADDCSYLGRWHHCTVTVTEDSQPPSSPPPGRWRRIWRWLVRNRLECIKGLGAVAAVAIAVTGFTVTILTYGEAKDSAKTAAREAGTAEQGLVTDRFKGGVEELGGNDENVQAGGIFILARVAKDSPADADTAYDVILSFVSDHLCSNKLDKNGATAPGKTPGPPKSVVAALKVLRTAHRQIDLRALSCQHADLTAIDLTGAELARADLSGSKLTRADLTESDLSCALLDSTDFTGRTILTGITLNNATLTNAGLEGVLGLTEQQLRSAYWDQPSPTVDPTKKATVAKLSKRRQPPPVC